MFIKILLLFSALIDFGASKVMKLDSPYLNDEYLHEQSENSVDNNEVGSYSDELMEEVTFILLTKSKSRILSGFRDNDGVGIPISVDNSSEYLREVFDPNAETKFLVHGWLSSMDSMIVKTTVYKKNRNTNVVAIDWSYLAGWKAYPLSAYNVGNIGSKIADLVDKLIESEVTTLDKLHLIGHSLGAHVMGIAGSRVKAGNVSRITGLDPAKPGFEHIVYESHRLDPSDANFVDVIHTAAGSAGYYGTLGHVDFYPNGGAPPQPGCFDIHEPTKLFGCSHGRSYEYYVESILNPTGFKSVECESWSSYTSGKCKDNKVAYMGDPVTPETRGIFYLETNSESPFAKG